MTTHRRLAVLALLLPLAVLMLMGSTTALAQEDPTHDDWYALFVNGKKSGYLHERTVKSEEDDRTVWVTTSDMSMSMARGPTVITTETKSEIVEDEKGMVLRFTKVDTSSDLPKKTEGKVENGKIHLVQMGMARVIDYPKGAVGPAAVERLTLEKGFAPGTTYEVLTFDVDVLETGVTAEIEVGELEKKDVLGRVVMLHRVTARLSILPFPMISWINDQGDALVMEIAIPGMAMKMLKTDEKVALASAEPAELFLSTFVRPDRRIANPRRLQRAVYRLGKKQGVLEEIYEGEGQEILARKDGGIDIEVVAEAPGEGFEPYTLPVKAGEGVEASWLSPAPYVESEDEAVVALAREAVGDEKNALEAARRIENFVREKIKEKNLNVGFASAAEVARTLEGDCTEHGILCCAIARAVGLPSRVVTGLVYLPPPKSGPGSDSTGVFGYHMWAEVLVGKDRWLPIDAAIGAHDATHIVLAKSDLSAVNPSLEMGLVVLDIIGNLTIEVLEPK